MRTARAPFLVLLLMLPLISACRQDDPVMPGRELDAAPAPQFALLNSDGQEITLAQYSGRPVIVSFLYTDCPDVCPVIGQRIGQALRSLDGRASDVAVLIVSVDPEGDTPETVAAFMERHGLVGPDRHYLLGDEETLPPVWLSYGVGTAPLTAASRQPGQPSQFGRIGHTDATYLIDRKGQKRTLLRSDASAEEIARGLRILLR